MLSGYGLKNLQSDASAELEIEDPWPQKLARSAQLLASIENHVAYTWARWRLEQAPTILNSVAYLVWSYSARLKFYIQGFNLPGS